MEDITMIDKRIYYCWFGDKEMSELDKKCMETWKQFCPDYEIVKISEENYDYKSNPYALAGYETGDWSAVSNAARLEFLKNGNGFYLDTDVRLFKSLEELRKYDKGFITEFDSGEPDSAILGCGEGFPEFYEETYKRLVPGTVLHKEFIQLLYGRYDVHGEPLKTFDDGFTVIGEEYFPTVRTGLYTPNTIGIHYFENTWMGIKRSVTDGFYPFPRVKAYIGNQLLHTDDNPEIILILKNLTRKWADPQVLGRTLYFFNPRVVSLTTQDFSAQRIDMDSSKPFTYTVTPSGMLVGHYKEEE